MKKLFVIFSLFATYQVSAQQGMGVGNNNPLEMLDVTGAIKVGTDLNNGTGAPSGGAGTIRYRSGQFEGWNGSAWIPFASSGTLSGSGSATRVAFWSSANALSSSNNLYWDNVNNRLGVGITSPLGVISAGNTFGNKLLAYDDGTSAAGLGIQAGALQMFTSNNTSNIVFGYGNSGSFTENVRFTGSGNVGIGTTNPTAKLEVAGQVKITGGTPGANKVLTSDAVGLATWVDPNTLVSGIMPSGTTGQTLRHNGTSWIANSQLFNNGSNVGIGTTSPAELLHIYSPTYTGLLIENPSSNLYAAANWKNDMGDLTQMLVSGSGFSNGIFGPRSASFNNNGPGGINLVAYNAAGVIRFATGGLATTNERMRIDAGGNVGIGTMNPTRGKLVAVANNGFFATSLVSDNAGRGIELIGTDFNFLTTGSAISMDLGTGSGNTYSSLQAYTAGKSASGSLVLQPTFGNVGVGTITPSSKLEVAGQVKITGGTPGAGKVLTSDAVGLASWVDPNTLVIADNLGDHTATATLQLNNNWLSNDGGSEGIRIDNSGNVGIGEAVPSGPIHVNTATAGRYMRYHSFGNLSLFNPTGNTVELRLGEAYGRPGLYSSGRLELHSQSTGIIFGNNDVEYMRMSSTGSIGIGTNAPESLLNVVVANNGVNVPLVLRNTNTVQGGNAVGLGFANGDVNNAPLKAMIINERTETFGRGKLHFIMNDAASAAAATLTDAKMTLDRSGNLGIGTTSPTAKLDIAGTVAMNDNQIRLRGGSDGNHFLSYIGGAFDGAKLTGNNNVILNTMTGGDALIVTGNRVGIGTPSPIAPLHVESQASPSYGNFTYYAFQTNAGSGSCCAGTVNGVSIHASGRVMASEFDAFSDARIKQVIGLSNSEEDLQHLLGIQITDYRMKDQAKDLKPYKKVIAQQVEEVFPEAVSTITEVIPDIYALASVANGTIALKADVKVGDRLRLIRESGNEMVTVIQVQETGFVIDSDITEQVFVYGREVSDFRTVDYEAISMLNVSATQELFRMIQELKSSNETLQSAMKKYASLETELEKLKNFVGMNSTSDSNTEVK